MKKLLVILLIIIAHETYAQKELYSVKLNDEHTWKSHSQEQLNEYFFNVKSIEKSDYSYHFQHQRDGQLIEVYSEDGKNFKGYLTNSIIQYKSVRGDFGKDLEEHQYIFEKVKLEKAKSTKLGKLILSQKFYEIPTDSLIKGWNFYWLDCGSISFSFKTNSSIHDSEYSCHWQQNDSINHITEIKLMYDTISQILSLETKYSEFESKLKKGKTYSRNGFVMMYLMTDKQSLAFQKSKPERDYLKSIKKSVDSHLKSEIEKQNVQFHGIDCFQDYRLTFNENGKLKKVKVSDYDKPKLSDGFDFYLEDKREIRKCRELIKQLFKKIDLSALNLKCEINRTLSFGLNNEAHLRDDMLY